MALTSLDPLLNVYSAETRKEIVQILLKRGFFKEKKTILAISPGWPRGSVIPLGGSCVLAVVCFFLPGGFESFLTSALIWVALIQLLVERARWNSRDCELSADEFGLELRQAQKRVWSCPWSEVGNVRVDSSIFDSNGCLGSIVAPTSSGVKRLPLTFASEKGIGGLLIRLTCPPASIDGGGSRILLAAGSLGCILLAVGLRASLSLVHPGLALKLLTCGIFALQLLCGTVAGNELWKLAKLASHARLQSSAQVLSPETYASWIQRGQAGYEIDEGLDYAVPIRVLRALAFTRGGPWCNAMSLVSTFAVVSSVLDLVMAIGLLNPGSQRMLLSAICLFSIINLAAVALGLNLGLPMALLRATYHRTASQITLRMPDGGILKTNNDYGKEHSGSLLGQTYVIGFLYRTLPIGILEPKNSPGQ